MTWDRAHPGLPSQACYLTSQGQTPHYTLICKKGGFVSLRHNNLRDVTADILRSHSIRKDVQVEPVLLPVTGEHLTAETVMGEARLDVSARNFWSPLAKAFVDIRVFHPMAPSNASKSIPVMYISHAPVARRFIYYRCNVANGGKLKHCALFIIALQ